ncbi:MAG: chromosome segregation protein SMC [Lachnospiraceae bacterium]|nr:chromosome segregation protein SMC [Lachnospiraceae bacterium]
MYLKRIEVHGFKSFANKITFQFDNGITGIVGPNGSGKSNVADAVRWVLGEQKVKQLRSSTMQDVIFSGTQLRKPMGYAYVSITLDNADHSLPIDFEEVTVSRRVYRSGESEYLINGAPCRLRDIYEMFYDTGIGKEGYSIIGQGQIDKILSGRPEERRELFDEAAGIVKFKRRKDTAVKKLEDERANMVRIKDILSELERQVEPLEKQSEVAKEFLKKKEELKSLDVNMFLLESDRVREQLQGLNDKIATAEHDLNEAKESYENSKQEHAALQEAVAALDAQIEEKRKALSDNSLLREKLEGEIKVLQEKINSARTNNEHYENRKNTLNEDIARKESEKNKLLASKSELDKQAEELQEKRNAEGAVLAEIQTKIAELTDGVEKNQNDIIETLNARATIKTTMGRFESMLEQINIRHAEIQSRLLAAKSEDVEQEQTIAALTGELNEILAQIQESDAKRSELEDRLLSFRKALENKDNELSAAQVAYHQEKSKLDALKNISERYDGYGGSIRLVMEQKNKNQGIIGVVADIISVDKKYETAIETALGGNIQNIVTADEQVAKKMISFLKANRGGRATFLPLTTVKGRGEYDYPEIKNETGFLGMANDLVDADGKYEQVISQLLGAIVVIDTIDHALAIAKKFKYKVRLVTLEGEYLTPGGALAGGAFKDQSNLLGRKREIEELEENVRKSLEKIEKLKGDIVTIKQDRTKVRDELEQIKELQQDQFIKQNTAQLNVDSAKLKKSGLADDLKALQEENREIEEQAEQIKNDRENIKTELSDSEKREKELERQIAGFGSELEKLRDEETRQVLSTSELDLKVSESQQKQEFAAQNLARVEAEMNRLLEERDGIDTSLKEAENDILNKQNDILEIQKTIAASDTKESDEQDELNEAIKQKEEMTAKQQGFFDKREELSEKINSLDKEVFRLNNQKERAEESQEGQAAYMWSEYELTYTQALPLRDETLTEMAPIRKRIQKLKEEIRDLGDVNVNAIEDYKNLMERYTFMKEQHDDLVKAEETLIGIIDELDTSMRKQFDEKFKEINHEYNKVFKELFGGGEGKLELQENEDILEAGIMISAQPPGKKLQNMMQLSGGEKALTAISLLFAIQNLKPSPFCLLDEIEAALDEPNVGRFANYLHKLTKHTQFIVITHRRGTMEKADRLYGITMQEKGVSALVSVNLIDKDLED